jgi:integrase
MANLKFTEKLVEALEGEAGKESFFWDTEQPGLGMRITAKGRKSYFVFYRTQDGQQRRPALGLIRDLSLKEAREMAQEYRAAACKGLDPVAARREARNALTLRQFAEIYMAEHAEKRKKPLSVAGDRGNLDNHILPRLGDTKLDRITRPDITRFHRDMSGQPSAGNRCLALLSKMFNLAEAWGYRKDGTNPCLHVERYKENKRERYLTVEELGRLGKVLAEVEGSDTERPAVVAAIRLLLFTGCRRDEILTLRWDYVDFAAGCLRLPDSKTGAKIVWLNAPALAVLRGMERHESNSWVIPGQRRGARLVNISKPWHRIRAAAKLPDLRLHDLRHSFASMGANAGLGLPLLGALLGHKDSGTTARYAHLAANPVKEAGDKIGQALKEALAGKEGGRQ